MSERDKYVFGIDASNLRSGGGIRHLSEFIKNTSLPGNGFNKAIIWASPETLKKLSVIPHWLEVKSVPAFERSIIHRILWRFCCMRNDVKRHCDVLFSPGGLALHASIPEVVMSRNLQPFDKAEIKATPWGYQKLRLILLRWAQGRSFVKSDCVIFLNEYAKKVVCGQLSGKPRSVAIIPHGCSEKFRLLGTRSYTASSRVLYVSTINSYKHQVELVEACAQIRNTGKDIQLHLAGGGYEPYLTQVRSLIDAMNSESKWVYYHGLVGSDELKQLYEKADIFAFPSSCENLPNVLIEAMSSGLPIICSDVQPMPMILSDGGVYFDPSNPMEIARALNKVMESSEFRAELAGKALMLSSKYTWQRCVADTLEVLLNVASSPRKA